jgi:hypothetical protein
MMMPGISGWLADLCVEGGRLGDGRKESDKGYRPQVNMYGCEDDNRRDPASSTML